MLPCKLYVTIDSVMLQVQRYLHVNRQKKKETFAYCGKSLLREKAAVMQHIENVQMFWETQILGDQEKKMEKSRSPNISEMFTNT